MSAHTVTAKWEWMGGPYLTFKCEAPADALCHATFSCECESWSDAGVEDGVPWHTNGGEWDGELNDLPRHVGTFDPAMCSDKEWFDNQDECLRGSVTFPVAADFQGDYVEFVVEATS